MDDKGQKWRPESDNDCGIWRLPSVTDDDVLRWPSAIAALMRGLPPT